MEKILHDFILIDPKKSEGALKTNLRDDIYSGVVKDFGSHYWTDTGSKVDVTGISIGNTVLFTQFLKIDDNGEEIYVVRWRDIIRVKSDI